VIEPVETSIPEYDIFYKCYNFYLVLFSVIFFLMKIGFDIRPFLSSETGVGVYFKNLLHSMAELESDNSFYLFSSSFKERFPEELLPDFKNRKFRDLRIPVSILNFLWFRFRFPPMGYFFGTKLDLAHSPNPLITPGGKKKIVTVHDLSFIDSPDLVMEEATKYFTPLIKNSLKKADGIIAVSEFTRSRIGEIFGKDLEDKTTVIYHGSDLDNVKERKPAFVIPGKYFLFTGTIEPRKNLTTLIKGFALAKQSINEAKLILAGCKGKQTEEIRRLISILKLDSDVIFTGYLDRGELKYLYKNTSALVFPSHYEGFGLPVLEAASCGIPSIVSDIEVFREIFGNYPLYFDKSDPESLASLLTKIWSDKSLYNKKVKEALMLSTKFSWNKAAKETLETYNSV